MALQLGQVEVRPRAAVDQLLRVVKKVEPEIEQAPRNRLAIDGHVPLVEVPASRAHQERCGFGVERILPPIRVLEGDRAANRVVEILLPIDDVVPCGGRGVLQVGHEDLGPGVESVDDHLAVARPGDLDPAILQVVRRGSDLPVVLANRCGFREESQLGAGIDRGLALFPVLEQLQPTRVEEAMEIGDEGQRLGRQDPLVLRPDFTMDLDPRRHTLSELRNSCRDRLHEMESRPSYRIHRSWPERARH